ncbi:MAG: diguanylate cyclase [Chloroflexi bacterium]|nr:diguanylate cyclase [Chloroflexota bacterium]
MSSEEGINHETGLFTRSMIEILLSHEITRSLRYPSPLTILRLALHVAAPLDDALLRKAHLMVSDLLNTNLRASDAPGHYDGGYLIIAPATPADGGLVIASRLAHRIKILHPMDSHTQLLDMSACIGVASHAGGRELSEINLLEQANIALAEAQRRGAHSVVNFNDLEK